MKKQAWFAHPVLTLVLAVSWLLLQHSLALVHLMSAALIGLLVPRLLSEFLPAPSVIRWQPVPGLLRSVVWDIITSNVYVARQVLGPLDALQPAWFAVPLTVAHPTAISLLAAIITTTPGTVSCHIDETRHEILVHALNCDDPEQMVQDIKARYEIPLMAIFDAPRVRQGATP